MCIPPILVGASLEAGATFLMRRIPEPCNWRLIIWKGSCATNDESELPPILISLLAMRRMVVIGPGRRPPNESFSCDGDYHQGCRNKSPFCKSLGNNAMSKALNQISKSPFTRRIEGRRLSRLFTQPTFTMYNGRTDPMKHMSHFNQRIAFHSRNEALMCKVFPSSLEPVAMRWMMAWE